MSVLITGADGFVGSRLVSHLADHGTDVVGTIRKGQDREELLGRRPELERATDLVELELDDPDSIAVVGARSYTGVVHLAAVSSVSQAAGDPAHAWLINVMGTLRLAEAVAPQRPRFLMVSSAEVYGAQPPPPRTEEDAPHPVSTYAATKLAAEYAVWDVARRTGMPAIVVRPFGHTGSGQATSFVAPAFAERVTIAKRVGAPAVAVGNLEPVREFLHVDDVVEAYRRLLAKGESGTIYNVAGGEGVTLAHLLRRIGDIVGHAVIPEMDSALVRAVDVPYLVGAADRLRAATGWTPTHTLDETLIEVVNAQAH